MTVDESGRSPDQETERTGVPAVNPRYDALLFDLDETLVEYERRSGDVFRAACEAVGIEPFCDPDTLELANEAVRRQSTGLDATAFERRIFETAAAAAGAQVDAGTLAEAYDRILRDTSVSLRDGASPALEAAAPYDTAVVTNGPERTHAEKLAAVDVAEQFDAVVFGSDVDRVKPAREPFELALQRLEADPDRVLKIGDSLVADVAGAADLGIDTAWIPRDGRIRTPGDPEPTYTLSSLAELPTILE